MERQEREAAEKRRTLLESSLLVAQTEEEENQTEENQKAFSSDLATIAVSEGERNSNRKLVKTPSAKLHVSAAQADIKHQINISLTFTIKFDFTLD